MMTTPPQPYGQFQNPSEAAPPPKDPTKWKRYAALILGVLQICLATLMLGVGIMKDALWVPSYGLHAYIINAMNLVSGASAIQYSQFSSRSGAILAIVFSVLACLASGSGFIVNCVLIYTEEVVNSNLQDLIDWGEIDSTNKQALVTAEMTIRHTMLYAAESASAIMIFGCVVNGIVSLCQIVCASLMLCSCGRKTENTNTMIYMANNPTPESNGTQGPAVIMTAA